MRPLPKSAVGPINNIGFFHFGSDDKSDPMRSLAISLEKAVTTKRCLTGSLLVLPEAFNIRNDYQTLSAPDPSVVYALKEMSKEHGMAFVAGLLHRRTRYSCAHLIDGDTCRLLSRKRDRDGSPNYQPYEGVSDGPCLHRGVWIAALICHDAAGNPAPGGNWDQKRQWQAAMAKQIEACKDCVHALLCIPGRMVTVSSKSVATSWSSQRPDLTVVVANATSSQPSVIRYGKWSVCSEKAGNAVWLRPWTELKDQA